MYPASFICKQVATTTGTLTPDPVVSVHMTHELGRDEIIRDWLLAAELRTAQLMKL